MFDPVRFKVTGSMESLVYTDNPQVVVITYRCSR